MGFLLMFGTDTLVMGRFLDDAHRNSIGPQEGPCRIPNVDILAKNEADAIEGGRKP